MTITCAGQQGLDAVECLKKIKHADLSEVKISFLVAREERDFLGFVLS